MKNTLSTSEAANMLVADDNADWSYEGARRLIEYIEEIESETGVEIDFDRVALRCEFTEYSSIDDAMSQYVTNEELVGIDDPEEWLSERTTVLMLKSDGVVIQDF